MTSPTQVLVGLYRLVLLLASWVVRGVQFLACLLEPAQPPAELPLATLSPVPFYVASEGVSATGAQSEDPKIENLPLSPPKNLVTYPRCNLELNGAQRNVIHLEERDVCGVSNLLKGDEPPSNLSDKRRERRVNLAPLFVMEDAMPRPTSPTQSVYYTPSLFDSLTSTPLTSPCTSPEELPGSNVPDSEQRYDERLLKARKFEAEIGDLGKRRGFKGAPLIIKATRKYSPFHSLPNLSSRSPTSSTLISPRPLTSRTPLSTVTNMIRSVSSSKPVDLAKGIPGDLQGIIDQVDPFAISANTFFTSSVSFGNVLTMDLDNFGSYRQLDGLHSRTPSLKRKSNFEDLRTAASPTKRTGVRATFYGVSTSSLYRKEKLSSKLLSQEVCASPKIVLTVPSAPSSPTKANNGIAGSTPDSGARANIAPEILHPDYKASSPGPPPVSDLFRIYTNDYFSGRGRPVLEEVKEDASPHHQFSNTGTNDSDVTCALGLNDTCITTADITIYDPTSRERAHQDGPVNSGFSFESQCKSDPSDKLDCMPESPKDLVTENFFDFDIYRSTMYSSPEKAHGNYCPRDSLLAPSNVELANMETTIYDLSIYPEDVQPPYSTVIGCTRRRVTTEPSAHRVQMDQIHLSWPNRKLVDRPDTFLPTPITRTSTLRLNALTTHPINRLGKVEDHKEALICFPPATRVLSSEKKGPSASCQTSHATELKRGRRSQGLDEIIALLDTCVSESSQDVVSVRRSIALKDGLWDEGSLLELYAI